MTKRKGQEETAPTEGTKRTLRQQRHGSSHHGMSECLRCQALSESGVHVLSFKDLKEGPDNCCQTCTVIIEAANTFFSLDERRNLGEILTQCGDNGLWEVSLRGTNSEGEYGQIGAYEKASYTSIPRGNIRQNYTGSRVYLDYILPWTKRCAEEHPICSSYQNSYIPKRVLDVGCFDGDEPRLLETHVTEMSEKYICLSHQWGTYKPLQTTKKNLADHNAGIPWTTLPPTFRDAIEITRFLDVRFLWIDSLCIVQDDHDDWVAQSGQMAKIYGNSFLTISATISEDALSGIFRRIPLHAGHVEVPHQVSLKESTGVFVRSVISHQQFHLFDKYPYGDHCKEWDSQYPLMGRAWAYQEHILSPRVIHFGHREIFWQCSAASWCCCSPNPIRNGLKSSIARALDTGTTGETSGGLSILACWERIVRYYSNKSITKEEDRLPALSGIAQRFQSVRNSRYLAGLWEDYLINDLCWMVHVQGKRPKKYLAPSWSWCSVFVYATCRDDLKLSRVDIDVQEVSCTPSTSDPTGAVSSGSIRLSGFLLQGKAVIPADGTSPIFQVRDMEFRFFPDALHDDLAAIRSSKYTLYGLKVGSQGQAQTPTLYVLVLIKSNRLKSQFQRVGIAELNDDTWKSIFNKKQTITII